MQIRNPRPQKTIGTMSQHQNRATPGHPAFEPHYLQRATQELAEDLDKVRNTNDFKAESIQFLVHALQQGASQFSPDEQRRVVNASHADGKQ